MPKKLQVITVKSELGAGTRGSSLGFEALQIASLKYDAGFFKNREEINVKTLNHKLFDKVELRYAKRLDGIAKMYRRIAKEVSDTLETGDFPFVFAGDHSNAGGTIAGIKEAFPNKRLGAVWVDAHADLHSPYTSPSGNVHGMPLATAIHEDNLENQNNTPEDETVWHWNEMKGPNQRVRPSDLFFISVRDTEEPESNLMAKHQMPNIKTAEVRKMGARKAAEKALEHLEDCDIIYVSFDVDSMDPEISVGTGTPVPNGLWEDEAREILLAFAESEKLVCMETTEINPLLDLKGNAMAEAAFRVVKSVIEKIESRF